jgi:hypothetical protein
MRHPVSTTPNGAPTRRLTGRVRTRLPLATIEELDHLAEIYHLTRQQVLRQILTAALVSDAPLQPLGPEARERLSTHARLTYARSFELTHGSAES